MKIDAEVEIDITNHLDRDDIFSLMEEYDISTLGLDIKKLSLVDRGKLDLFIEKFESIPLSDFEEFLNKY